MKITVIYDNKGKIISAGKMEQKGQVRSGAPAPKIKAKARTGQKVAEIEVPKEHEKLPLHELIEKLEVESKGKEPSLRSKKPQ